MSFGLWCQRCGVGVSGGALCQTCEVAKRIEDLKARVLELKSENEALLARYLDEACVDRAKVFIRDAVLSGNVYAWSRIAHGALLAATGDVQRARAVLAGVDKEDGR
jgi:hypothetical protein